MTTLLRDLLARNRALYGRDAAVVFRDEATTWAAFERRVFQLANRLLSAGVERQDRVAILQHNGPEVGEVGFAVALIGAVLVPISPRYAAAEVAYLLDDAEVHLAFVDARLGELVTNASSSVVQTRCDEYDAFVAEGAEEEPPRVERAEDVVLQLYTSGTTGQPKGAMLTQAAMVFNGLTTMNYQQAVHSDVFLTATPLSHAAGAVRMYALAIDGIPNVILERYDVQAFLDAIASHRVTTTILVPTMLRMLLDSPQLDAADLGTLRAIIYGAAPTPRSLIEEALTRLPCGFYNAYGLTEGCPAITALNPAEHLLAMRDPKHRGLLGSIGRSVPGVHVSIGQPGTGHPPSEPAELFVRSAKNMVGYWKRPEETEMALTNGWLASGDIGYADADGYIYLVDRAKDMFISGGLNVYPSEVERVIERERFVREVAVVGVPDEKWGEAPVAFVVGDADGESELRAACRRDLATYKVPKAFVFLAELPRNSNGKVLKRELRTSWVGDPGDGATGQDSQAS
jgi:acyl-CoA synthetase (AMP-forming)/AMP-acid ligase II